MKKPSKRFSQVELFTDGACSGNPGPGGWAFLLKHPISGDELERFGADGETTNNRMELTAVLEGFKALKTPTKIQLFTDSVYVAKGLSEWLPKWKTNGWRRKEGTRLVPIKNEDLWRQLDRLTSEHEIEYHRIPGHSGHPENERCDQLAVAAYQKYLQQK